ncbi:MAG: EAL domain-containing protein [Bacilli bacterium]|nr:EAL domain-containing protein [Bacilli bacterium]
MRRLLNFFASRFSYKTHKRNSYIIYIILAINTIASIVLYTIMIRGYYKPGFIISLYVTVIVNAVLIVVAILYQDVLAMSALDRDIAKDNFTKEIYIFNESALRQSFSHMMRRRKAESLFAVLDVRDITRLRSIYGQKGPRIINDALYAAIHEAVGKDNKNYAYGFSPIKGWILIKKGGEESLFIEELQSICQRVNYILEKDGTMPDVAILCGVYHAYHGQSFEDVYSKAQIAGTYNLSSRISSDVIVYSEEFMMDDEGERSLSSELGNAINEEQLQVFYQPKFDLQNDFFFGAEALIRWNHPSRGLLPPSLFIPFAEQSGRIIEVDKYVFEQVCKNMVKWKNEGKRIPKVSINLSRKTALAPDILTFYKETMEKYEINPKWIEIELTESMAAQDAVFVSAMIRKIKALDLDTSIDDFGMGYSAFSSLKKIPFDTLKIDKSFIDEFELDQKSRDLVRCINDISHSLGMKTIAEGVETENQKNIVKELGIDAVQGYYYSRPLGEFEFQRFLSNNPFEKKKKQEEVAK